MLIVVKMLLKREVGGHVFNKLIVMEITLLIMENHGKIMEKSWNCIFEFLWETWSKWILNHNLCGYLAHTDELVDIAENQKKHFFRTCLNNCYLHSFFVLLIIYWKPVNIYLV